MKAELRKYHATNQSIRQLRNKRAGVSMLSNILMQNILQKQGCVIDPFYSVVDFGCPIP